MRREVLVHDLVLLEKRQRLRATFKQKFEELCNRAPTRSQCSGLFGVLPSKAACVPIANA